MDKYNSDVEKTLYEESSRSDSCVGLGTSDYNPGPADSDTEIKEDVSEPAYSDTETEEDDSEREII